MALQCGAMTKTCKVCGATDATDEFYAGISNRCKECHKAAVRKNRADNVDRYREYDAHRFQNDPRVKERHKRYLATEAGKESMNKARKKWLDVDPRRRAAHVILNNAVRDGRIERPEACSHCGITGKVEGHHPDYDYPLNVVWLCPKCHDNTHKDLDDGA